MMEYSLKLSAPCAIRYPRGPAEVLKSDFKDIDGSCEIIDKGRDAVIFAVGRSVRSAKEAVGILRQKGIDCGLVNVRFVKPLDMKGLEEAAEGVKLIVTLEDNVVAGGFGQQISAHFANKGNTVKTVNLGWPDEFIRNGKTEELEKIYGLDPESVADRIINEI